MPVRISTRKNLRNRGGSQTLLGLGLLSVSILLGALILSRSGQPPVVKESKPTVVAEYDTVKIPVPVRAVPAGTDIRDIEFKFVTYPRHQLPDGALMNVSEVGESYTVAPLPANLPLFKGNFSNAGSQSNPVIEQIPRGMRAITLRVDETSSVEGWAQSGSVVDVLLVEQDGTTVVAESVKILSAERQVTPPAQQSGAPRVPSTVTLLVTQEQALAISTAVPRGKIAFALRSLGDDQRWRNRVYTADRLRSGQTPKSGDGTVTGYVSVTEGEERYALSGGKWVKTETIPEGFMVSDEG